MACDFDYNVTLLNKIPLCHESPIISEEDGHPVEKVRRWEGGCLSDGNKLLTLSKARRDGRLLRRSEGGRYPRPLAPVTAACYPHPMHKLEHYL